MALAFGLNLFDKKLKKLKESFFQLSIIQISSKAGCKNVNVIKSWFLNKHHIQVRINLFFNNKQTA